MTNLLMGIGAVLATLFVIAAISVISILWWHNRSKNRFDLALFLIDDGNETMTQKAKLMGRTKDAVVYLAENKTGKSVFVPNDYGVNYVKHRRRIDITANYNLVYSKDKLILESSKYATIIKELTLDHIGADIVRAMKSKSLSITTIIIIAIAALVIGVVGASVYNNMRKPKTLPVSNTTNTTQQFLPTVTPIRQGETR